MPARQELRVAPAVNQRLAGRRRTRERRTQVDRRDEGIVISATDAGPHGHERVSRAGEHIGREKRQLPRAQIRIGDQLRRAPARRNAHQAALPVRNEIDHVRRVPAPALGARRGADRRWRAARERHALKPPVGEEPQLRPVRREERRIRPRRAGNRAGFQPVHPPHVQHRVRRSTRDEHHRRPIGRDRDRPAGRVGQHEVSAHALRTLPANPEPASSAAPMSPREAEPPPPAD